MRHRIYVHITWTTRDREPAIDADSATLLHRLLPAIARQERTHVLELGIVRIDVQLVLLVRATRVRPPLGQRLKGVNWVVVCRESGASV